MSEPPFRPFDEEIRRMVMEAAKRLDPSPLGEAFGGPPQPERPILSVKKHGFLIPVVNETLMDAGLIPDTREPVKVSRWWRARWRIREAVTSARIKVGEKIAGVELEDRGGW